MAEIVEFVDPAKRSGSYGDYKRNRKLFMSSKASDILKDTSLVKKEPTKNDEEEEEFNFENIFKRMEKLVAESHSTWKERKLAEQRRAEQLGAKPVKNIKQPIDIVKSMGKKRKEREEAQRQLDIAAGNYVKQDKKRRKTRSEEDRELQVGDGKFKGGVLYVKPMAKDSEHGGRNEGTTTRRKGKFPKKKGSQGRKGGKKRQRK